MKYFLWSHTHVKELRKVGLNRTMHASIPQYSIFTYYISQTRS